MSLLDEAFTPCVFINAAKRKDGVGGWITDYTDGEQFDAAIVLDSSTQAKIAEKMGVTALYTVTTGRELTLDYHDIFRRISDGKVFRVTSDGTDKKTPPTAGLNMRQVSAEEYKLPIKT